MTPDAQMPTGGKQIHLTRRSPSYWRVTIDHPPLNIFGPETIPSSMRVITALETAENVTAVVFDSAVDGFFLTHYDFLARLEDTTRLAPRWLRLSNHSRSSYRRSIPHQSRVGRFRCRFLRNVAPGVTGMRARPSQLTGRDSRTVR